MTYQAVARFLSVNKITNFLMIHYINYMENNIEIWKDIPDYEGYYQVSNLGNVRSLDRVIKGKGGYDKIKKGSLVEKHIIKRLGKGRHTTERIYYRVRLNKFGIRKSFAIHRLVYEAFNGKINDNLIIDHIDNISTNNRLENLQMISYRENTIKDLDKSKTTSKYMGVYFRKDRNKFVSSIIIDNEKIQLYYGDSEYEAHLAYQRKLKEIYG